MNRDFDNIFKSKLANHESPYPSNMWDAIDKEINPPRKNRGLLLLPIALITIMIVSYLVWEEINTSDPALSQEHSIPATSIVDNTNSNSSEPKLTADLNLNTLSLIEQSGETETYKSDVILGNDFDNNLTNRKSTNSELTAIYSELNSTVTSTIKKSFQSETTNTTLSTKAITKTSEVTNVENKESKKAVRRKSITFTQPLLSSSSRSKTTDELKNSNNASNSSLSLDRFINTPSVLESLVSIQEDREMEKFDMEVTPPMAATDCPSWVNEKLGLYLEIYGAPEYAVSSLTPKDRDSTIVAHQQTRNDTESARVSYSLGGRLLFLTPSGISFKIGMNYSQINEKFEWVDPETIKYIIEVNEETGDTISSTTIYGSEIFRIANSYKSLDIPLLIGFEKYSGNKLSLSANAGIYVNVLAEQRGMFIDPNGDRNWFSSSDNTHYKAYKNSVGISFFGSLGMMYHWVEGIDIFVEPSVRYYSQSMSLNNYPLNHRFVTFGLHTGIRYRF